MYRIGQKHNDWSGKGDDNKQKKRKYQQKRTKMPSAFSNRELPLKASSYRANRSHIWINGKNAEAAEPPQFHPQLLSNPNIETFT